MGRSILYVLKNPKEDFPGGPVVRTQHSQYRGPGQTLIRELDPCAVTKTQSSQVNKYIFKI